MKINDIKAALAARSAGIPAVNFGAAVPASTQPATDGANALAVQPNPNSVPIIKVASPAPAVQEATAAQPAPQAAPNGKVEDTPKPTRRRRTSTKKDDQPAVTDNAASTTTKDMTAPEAVAPSPAPAVHHESIEQIVAKHLVQGRDYDLIPGVGRKPSLLKPGAEKLAEVFGFYTETEILHRVELFDKSFLSYEVQVTVRDKDGRIVAQGIGSCNSRERKYIKQSFTDCANTVMKMAKKRAYVDAILTATHASGVFTQDIEDIARD